MFKILLLSTFIFSGYAFSQTPTKPNPNSQINAEEQVNGLPGGANGRSFSARTTKKKKFKLPANVAPVENTTPANCADSVGGTGGASYTACQAAEKTR
jgi:hypothetical protein